VSVPYNLDQSHISWMSLILAGSVPYKLNHSHISCVSPISVGSVPYQLVQPHTKWIIPISAGSVPYQIWKFRKRKKCPNHAGVRNPYLPASSLVPVRLSLVRYKPPVTDKTGSVRINVTLKSVRINISAVEKQCVLYFEMCVVVCFRACVALFI